MRIKVQTLKSSTIKSTLIMFFYLAWCVSGTSNLPGAFPPSLFPGAFFPFGAAGGGFGLPPVGDSLQNAAGGAGADGKKFAWLMKNIMRSNNFVLNDEYYAT